MKIIELKEIPGIVENVKLKEAYIQFEQLLSELRKRELPEGLLMSINKDIQEINSTSNSGFEMRKLITKNQTRIIKILEKEMKLVPKNYYSHLWPSLGMSVFGVPLGVVIGLSLHNLAFLGIGLPIGLVLGSAVGSSMDKKALEEGRQMDVEIKY